MTQGALPFDPHVDMPLTLAVPDRVLLAIDPGTARSAWVTWDGKRAEAQTETNDVLLERLCERRLEFFHVDELAIEMIASYGMAVGREVFETCVWIGRFVQAWAPRPHRLVYRRDVKLHLCGSARAKDPNVRQALLDRFGGKEAAVGSKKAPGPLYGVHGDEWSALAVALTAAETTT